MLYFVHRATDGYVEPCLYLCCIEQKCFTRIVLEAQYMSNYQTLNQLGKLTAKGSDVKRQTLLQT